jgi:diacylglycerol kinase family enzyme
LFTAEGHRVTAVSLKEDNWEEALTMETDITVVAGGDGSVQKVFTRLAGSENLATLLPLGSANNVARSLGFPEGEPRRLIRSWKAGRRLRYDIGLLTGEEGETCFVESVGGGLFAETILRAEASDSEKDKVNLGLELLRSVLDEAHTLEWEVEVDGVDLSGEFIAVEVMAVRDIGPRLTIAPQADPSDSKLEVILIREAHRSTLAAHLDARRAGAHTELPQLDVRSAERVELTLPAAAPFHIDDDVVVKESPATMAASIGSHVEVLVPPPELDQPPATA